MQILLKNKNALMEIFDKNVTPHNIYSPDNVIYIDTKNKDMANFIAQDVEHRGVRTSEFVKNRNTAFDSWYKTIMQTLAPHQPKMIASHIFKTSVSIHNDESFCVMTLCKYAVIIPISIVRNTAYGDAPLLPVLICSEGYKKLQEFDSFVFIPTEDHGLLSDHTMMCFVAWC